MARTVKTQEQLKKSLYLTKTEISRLFGCGNTAAGKCFDAAQRLDVHDLKDNYFNYSKVRMSSVLKVLGITVKELEKI